MHLEKPEVTARHRGVRPVFLLTLALALSVAVLVETRARRTNDETADRGGPSAFAMPGVRTSLAGSLPGMAHCNAIEVATYLASHDLGSGSNGAAQRAACLVVAGRIDAARQVILATAPPERDIVVNRVFLAGHPVADAGDDASAGPIMELVIEFQPNQYMALYHAGIAAAISGDDARARHHLSRFLQLYHAPDGWNQNARRALESLHRPQPQRRVNRGSEGSVIY